MKKDVEAIYPLSPTQQGMLFHTLLTPQAGEYCQQTTFILHGHLDVPAYQRAWQEVVNRHAILRSLFVWEGQEKPLQVVRRQVQLPWHLDDWCSFSAEQQATHLADFLDAAQAQGFDLKEAPLMRLALLQLAEDRYQFVWTYHHLLLDGWSLPILFEEIFTSYRAFLQGKTVVLARPRPYRDYIAWLQSQDQAQAETFWREQLQGLTSPTPLRIDRPVAEGDAAAYHEHLITLPATLDSGLRALAQQHHLTLNTLIQGAWALLLSRYSGQDDVLFGVTVSGRSAPLPDMEKMVGLFINTLPLRAPLTPDQPVVSWLQTVQANQIRAREFEYSSLVQVQGWSDVPRGRNLFETILVFENYPISHSIRQDEVGLQVHNVKAIERTNYPLTLLAVPGATFTLGLAYDTRRFEAQAIERMLGHLQTILAQLVANPQQNVSEVDLLTPAEKQQLLVTWNKPVTLEFQPTTLHALFENQVKRTPDNLALLAPDASTQQLSYHELDARANQLAHYLQAQGIGPEKIVAICLDRTPDMAVAILGVLKAGGAYLPLDPHYPPERLQFMLADSQADLLLTQTGLTLVTEGLPTVFLAENWPTISQYSADWLACSISPDHLAYVIYTSGSTGRPKGVMISHRALVNQTLAVAADYDLQPEDRVLQFAAISFDVLAEELFPTWARGAAAVLYPQQASASLAEFNQFLQLHRLTVLNLPAPYWHEWVTALSQSPADLPETLRLVIAGSDRVTAEHLGSWRTLVGDRIAWRNAYGLTETTITTTLLGDADVPADQSIVPIGRPIANNQVYVLDHQLRPTPAGVPGELYIAGEGLAQGYLRQPQQTAARFVPHPFSSLPGARMYKTGDQARWTEQGTLVFLGRVDDQVSIRGFRIEPGEIEAILAEQPGVAEAVVVVQPVAGGQLVAYLVGRPGPDVAAAIPDLSQLRQTLRRHLPAYMIPSHFVCLPTLPLLPNGKLDRQALPPPDESHIAPHDFVAPRHPLEELIAGIWADILNLSQVGVEDNFFALGGHSLLATQLISRLRDTFRLEIPMRALFEAPTVAGLAQLITDLRFTSGADSSIGQQPPPLQPLPDDFNRSETLSFAQSRLWFLHQLEPDSPAYNVPMAVRLTGPLNRQALAQSLTTIINRHQVLRTTFPATSGQPIQVIHPPITLAFVPGDPSAVAFAWQGNTVEHPLITLFHLPAAARWAWAEQFVKEEGHRPFDLRHDLPIRATLLCLDEDEHILTMIMHHIASDGWSVSLFTQELAALYQAFCADLPNPLPPLPVQYVDFAHWQRQWLSGEVMAQQLGYWQKQLAGVPTSLDLPTDRPRPRVQTFHGTNHLFTLPPALSEALKALSRRHGATLYMTLLAAFQVLLSRYSGQKDILVGSPIANRNRTEIESLIGFFANTLVLRGRMSGNPTFRDLLKQVRDTTLDAYAHQDLPFEKLVEEIDPTRDMSRSPLFQVMFIFLNVPSEALKLQNLTLAPASFSFDTAKFDLTLAIGETAQGLSGALEYNTDLFDASTIARLVEHFHNLLSDIVADPRQRIADLSLLSPAEETELLINWNATQMAVPDLCFHQLFEAQARQTPQATAVISGQHSLTYQQLDEQANRLAHHLQKQGVALETPVALCLDRSLDMMVALLAVLKAGGTYVPLDPSYPAERLAYMVADAGVKLIITQTHLTTALLEAGIPGAVALLTLDQAESVLENENTSQPVSLTTPENVAYIIYTSGSTGRPKGVQVLHRSVSNFLLSMRQKPGLTATDRLLAVTTLSFDIAVLELFLPLVTGGQVILATREIAQDGRQLAQAISDYGITVMQATPATWQLLLELGWPGNRRLKILCGGEPIPGELATRLLERRASLWNMYGPTETTIWSTTHPITPKDDTISIGRPIANTQIYLLDAHWRPVPVGAVGELYIGGTGVARGYWSRPRLTAERFIPDPFSPQPGQRLYGTGDLARYLPDGRLICLGRVDHQVKVRGYRIELGEIEAALERQPAVSRAVVVAREDVPGDKRLVAYVVPNTDWAQMTPGPETVTEQLTQWRSVWNETYQQKNGYHDPTFNTIGWKSAYTGQPIPDSEMKEWVEQTVRRLRPQASRRILEIGCGMGLLLFRLASETNQYWATDFSQFALEHIQTHLPPSLQAQVRLYQQQAHDFTHLENERFDLIILNSVVQYFPTVDYLLDVLEQALQVTAPGGTIFMGDVRHLAFQELFHASLQFREAADDVSLATLRERIQRSVNGEQELLLDPAFFPALAQRFPQIRHIQVLLKRGSPHNELSKFRYDVFLHVGEPVSTQTISDVYNWRQHPLSLDEIRHFLSAEQPATWGLRQVTNARLCQENAMTTWLKEGEPSETVGAWAQRVPSFVADGLDPEQVWQLGETLGYEVAITWSDNGPSGCFDALFVRQDSEPKLWIAPLGGRAAAEPRPWSTYATNPWQSRMRQTLIPTLRQAIQTLLPEYMLPAAYVLLDEFPLTPNGKVDRHALPPPDSRRSQPDSGFVAPRTPLEEGLAQIWGQVLGVARVGVQDNFFALGGHSLLATQVIARVRDMFDVELPLRTLFEAPTIAGVAEKMMHQEIAAADEALLAQLLANLA